MLIQKSVKLRARKSTLMHSLRALLIQKSVKLPVGADLLSCSLRALLIQKSVKQIFWHSLGFAFESFVNSEECKTNESISCLGRRFESFVNSEECKTSFPLVRGKPRLRALLIQKSVKPIIANGGEVCSLRALGLRYNRDTEEKA